MSTKQSSSFDCHRSNGGGVGSFARRCCECSHPGAHERTAAVKTLRVLVADDHRLMQAAIRRALAGADDFEIVHEVSVGSHVVPAVRETAPDVVLLDLRMPELDGLSCLERLRKHDPTVAVVILSSYSDPQQIEAARQGGARGYV